jgi:hypothetical protein
MKTVERNRKDGALNVAEMGELVGKKIHSLKMKNMQICQRLLLKKVCKMQLEQAPYQKDKKNLFAAMLYKVRFHQEVSV